MPGTRQEVEAVHPIISMMKGLGLNVQFASLDCIRPASDALACSILLRHLRVIVRTFVRALVRAITMEIITGVERRRRWRPEDKLRIVAEAE